MTLKPWADLINFPPLPAEQMAMTDRIFHGGSRVMCVPPPMDTDDDYVILTKPGKNVAFCAALSREGWALGGSDFLHTNGESPFKSFSMGDVNLIVSGEVEWYEKMLVATRLCTNFNIVDKQTRIKIFQGVVYGVAP